MGPVRAEVRTGRLRRAPDPLGVADPSSAVRPNHPRYEATATELTFSVAPDAPTPRIAASSSAVP